MNQLINKLIAIYPDDKDYISSLDKANIEILAAQSLPHKKEVSFVDLSLPSGKLWADQNEIGYFTFDEAVEKFGKRMPTADDFQELYDHCRWTWNDERLGYTITGPNGNAIFLPASGYNYGTGLDGVGYGGKYWSHTADNAESAWLLEFWSSDINTQDDDYQYAGFAVRLVRKA